MWPPGKSPCGTFSPCTEAEWVWRLHVYSSVSVPSLLSVSIGCPGQKAKSPDLTIIIKNTKPNRTIFCCIVPLFAWLHHVPPLRSIPSSAKWFVLFSAGTKTVISTGQKRKTKKPHPVVYSYHFPSLNVKNDCSTKFTRSERSTARPWPVRY